MGNSLGLGGKSCVKIMNINGETLKLRPPVRAGSVMETHPGHVLLDSDSVKHFGTQAKPLEPQMELKPKRLYFLVQLPKFPETSKAPARRVSSGIQMSAKDRLESLMLARRSASDLTVVNRASTSRDVGEGGGLRVRLRLPKAEVEKLMAESKDEADMAAKIIDFYRSGGAADESLLHRNGDDVFPKPSLKLREKKVSFLPINEERIHLAVAS